ncbi:MAG: hypothetical protein JST22_15315 [Bacteroidetes bacterium]|nr:hypothetical protein [Bacteroidota bacterium]
MKPNFSMPIIAAGSNYATIASRTTVTPVGNRGLEIKIKDANAAESTIYTALGGGISFFPDPAPATTGSVVIYSWIKDAAGAVSLVADAGSVPPNVPKPGLIVYENIEAQSVRDYVTGRANGMDRAALTEGWKFANTTPTPPIPSDSVMRAHIVDQTMLGKLLIYIVSAGEDIGTAATYTDGLETGSKFNYYWYDTDTQIMANRTADRELSPIPYIEALPGYDGKWANHPLVTKVADLDIPMDFYMKFEVYNPSINNYVSLSYVPVELWDDNGVSDNHLFDQSTFITDGDGKVTISCSNVRGLGTGAINDLYADIYIKVLTAGWTVTGREGETIYLPDEWRSGGPFGQWRAMDGTPGYFPDFRGTRIGTASQPAVYHVGFDYHINFWYNNITQGRGENAVRGMIVEVWSNPLIQDGTLLDTAYTDELGTIHGVFFGADPGTQVGIWNKWELRADATVGLKQTGANLFIASNPATQWLISDLTMPGIFPDGIPTIGRPAYPLMIEAKGDFANPLYVLKIAREINQFWFTMTEGSQFRWDGYEVSYNIYRLNDSGLSWPVGQIWLGENSSWSRETIFHETGHVIMWHMHNVTTLNIAMEFLHGKLKSNHDFPLVTNPVHAVIEGWAEFSGMFGEIHPSSRRGDVETVVLTDGAGHQHRIPLGPPMIDRGYSVEGAFADALFQIFENLVATPALFNNVPVNNGDTRIVLHETYTGDLNSEPGNAWIQNSGLHSRFVQMIWTPFVGTAGILGDAVGTVGVMNTILNYSPNFNIVHLLRAEMNAFNMNVMPAVGSSLGAGTNPGGAATGPAAGGTPFIITGYGFVAPSVAYGSGNTYIGRVVVTFDGIVAQSDVFDDGTITGTTPPRMISGKVSPGIVDVQLLVFVRVPSYTSFTPGVPPPTGWVEKSTLATQWHYT